MQTTASTCVFRCSLRPNPDDCTHGLQTLQRSGLPWLGGTWNSLLQTRTQDSSRHVTSHVRSAWCWRWPLDALMKELLWRNEKDLMSWGLRKCLMWRAVKVLELIFGGQHLQEMGLLFDVIWRSQVWQIVGCLLMVVHLFASRFHQKNCLYS